MVVDAAQLGSPCKDSVHFGAANAASAAAHKDLGVEDLDGGSEVLWRTEPEQAGQPIEMSVQARNDYWVVGQMEGRYTVMAHVGLLIAEHHHPAAGRRIAKGSKCLLQMKMAFQVAGTTDLPHSKARSCAVAVRNLSEAVGAGLSTWPAIQKEAQQEAM